MSGQIGRGEGVQVEHVCSPDWAGPAPGTRPGVVPLSLELGRSTSTVVLVEGARAYPDGVVLRIVVVVRASVEAHGDYLFDQLDALHGRGSLDRQSPERGGLCWGVGFGDGRTVTTMDGSGWVEVPGDVDPCDWHPPRPLIDGLDRPARHGERWSREFWLWPLPPAGDLRFTCVWHDRGIDATETATDAASLRDGARRCVDLWPPASSGARGGPGPAAD